MNPLHPLNTPKTATCPSCAQPLGNADDSPYFFSSAVPPRRVRMSAYSVRYRLRNGASGTLPTVAASSCDAVLATIEHFGDQLRSAAVKLAALDGTP